jgi:tRNA-splicing endonuclease subunit Sen54
MERPIEEEDAVEEEAPDWRMLLKYTKYVSALPFSVHLDLTHKIKHWPTQKTGFFRFIRSLGAQTAAGNSEPFIPRRGEKDFEPTEALAPTQLKALQESRQALFTALSAGIRGHSSRDHVRCVWTNHARRNASDNNSPSQDALAVVPPYVDGTAKGVMFSSIGRWSRERKRLELAPEELLYLIERGTVECWTADDPTRGLGAIPISVQRAWAEIIGTHQLSLERYQVLSISIQVLFSLIFSF